MSSLPRGWCWTTLGEVSQRDISQTGATGTKEFLYIDISSVDNVKKRIASPKTLRIAGAPSRARQQLQPLDVLVSMTRPNLNAVAMLSSEMCGAIGSTGFSVLRASLVMPEWLYYAVQTAGFVDAMCRVVQGALYPAVRPKDILSYRLSLPPLAEQRRIVAEIEKQFTRLDAGVAALKRVQANLKRYRSSVLKAACGSHLVPTEHELARKERRSYEPADKLLERILKERRARWNGKGEYEEPATPDKGDLPKLPAGWCWATTNQLANVVRGASPRPAGHPKYFGGAIPWITVGPLTADEQPYLHSVETTVTEAGREASRFVEPHTLLLTNSGATLGVPKLTLIGGCINDGVAALLNVDYPTKLFLYYFLRTQTERLRNINQGAAQPNLNTSIIKSICVPLPPLAEQQRIVTELERRLSVIDELETMIENNLKRAERLRQAILKRAFEGKLVPQDPNDEPAVKLLERIREQDRGASKPRAIRKHRVQSAT